MFQTEPQIEIGVTDFDSKTDTGISFELLNRKASGQRLSQLVDRLTAPTVIALDGPWGSGKSHFLKLWCGAQMNDGKALPVYFDAFAEDYLDDPLISLVAAMDQHQEKIETNGKAAKAFKAVKANAGKFIKFGLRAALAVTSAGVSEIAAPLADAAIAAAKDEGDGLIDQLWVNERSRAKALIDFKTALAELANERPIVLIIDELDRCRPDYALSLLEIAKHSFAVPNVHFLLGVNLEALEHSVRKRYGAGIDAGLYLQKFYHLRMGLPEDRVPESQNWRPIFEQQCRQLAVPDSLSEEFAAYLGRVARNHPVSLRDALRIGSRAALLPTLDPRKNSGRIAMQVCTVILEVLRPELYVRLRRGESILTELDSLFAIDAGDEIIPDDGEWLWHLWRLLLGDPSRETQEKMVGAFAIRARTPDLHRMLAQDLDLFTIPPPA